VHLAHMEDDVDIWCYAILELHARNNNDDLSCSHLKKLVVHKLWLWQGIKDLKHWWSSLSFLACNSKIHRHHPPQRAVLSQICWAPGSVRW